MFSYALGVSRGRLEDFLFEPEPEYLAAAALCSRATAFRRRKIRKVASPTTMTTAMAAPIMPPNWACVRPPEEGSDVASTFATAVTEGVNFVTAGEATGDEAIPSV
jgi:hypothetical protein